MAKPRNISRAALRAYGARRRVLMALGFDSYELYLASDLWRRIRNAKLEAEGRICYGCGAPDCVQVHHGDYERPTLEGKAPHRLMVVCDGCHGEIEYFGTLKVGPSEATARLFVIRKRFLQERAICNASAAAAKTPASTRQPTAETAQSEESPAGSATATPAAGATSALALREN